MKENKLKQFVGRRASIAAAVVSAFLGHSAFAVTSTNSVGPIHGRQITVTETPTIVGQGNSGNVAGLPVSVDKIPGIFDADSDGLVDWRYVWEVDGVAVGAEQLAGSITSIPPYPSVAADAGKSVRLRLKAVADPRSFPIETAVSEEAISEPLTLVAGSLNINLGDGQLFQTEAAENSPLTIDIAAAVDTANAGSNLTWNLVDGPDSGHFTMVDGILTLIEQDFETSQDADSNGTYVVDVAVTDTATNSSTTIKVEVTVTNVVEDVVSVRIVDDQSADVTGNPVVGTVLHSAVALAGVNGEETLDRSDAVYQWKRADSRTGGAVEDIVGATSPEYIITGADQGYTISLEVTGQ